MVLILTCCRDSRRVGSVRFAAPAPGSAEARIRAWPLRPVWVSRRLNEGLSGPIDAAAAWVEENRPAWFNEASPSLHAFNCDGELPVYTRNGVPDPPLRLSDAPAAIADVAALVELHKAVGEIWTIYLDQGWVQAARVVSPGSPDRRWQRRGVRRGRCRRFWRGRCRRFCRSGSPGRATACVTCLARGEDEGGRLSAARWVLVVGPPRDRPRAWSSGSPTGASSDGSRVDGPRAAPAGGIRSTQGRGRVAVSR